MQALVEAHGQGARARMLLESVARESWVQACGLWRREDGPDSWTALLVRGSPDCLHGRGFLEAVAAGRSSADLVPGRGVLLSGQSAGALALTYAGNPESEFELDLVSALLHVVRLADAAEQLESSARVEGFVPALPALPAQGAAGMGAGLEQPDCQPAQLLEGLCDSESEHCFRLRIAFRLELESGLGACRIALPPSEFVRAARNLVSNAREALEPRHEGGRILVSLGRAPDSQLQLSIEDSGPGLPHEILAALQGGGPEDLPGPGLGLAVSWGIALSVGGRLRVAQSSELGTKIEISLPLSTRS